MDLANEDVKTHARPYALDRFREEGATRLTPRYSQAFVRAGQISASGSHRVYAEWFGGQLAAYPGRVRSLGKNNPVFDALPQTEGNPGAAFRGTGPRMETGVLPKPAGSNEAVRVLTGLLNAGGPSQTIRRELGPLLFPGGEEVSAEGLIKEIERLALRQGEGTADG
jgi:hypothetical protein